MDGDRAKCDPVYAAEKEVEFVNRMRYADDHPRRVEAMQQLAQAKAAQDAAMPPAAKAARLKAAISDITSSLAAATAKRLAQEAQYHEVIAQLDSSQEELINLERDLVKAQTELKAQEALIVKSPP